MATVKLRIEFRTGEGQGMYLTSPDGRFRWEKEPYIVMDWNANGIWTKTVQLTPEELAKGFVYKYVLITNGEPQYEPSWRYYAFRPLAGDPTVVEVQDIWRPPGTALTVFESSLARELIFKRPSRMQAPAPTRGGPDSVHLRLQCFNSEVPADKHMVVTGSTPTLGSWDLKKGLKLTFDDEARVWFADMWVTHADFPLEYKYVVVDEKCEYTYWESLRFNRSAPKDEVMGGGNGRVVVRTDDFALPDTGVWHGTGVAIPVFSLRSRSSMGIGEFLDIKLLVDWAASVGICLVQLLPVSDSGYDSSPYGVMSSMALNPVYLNLDVIARENGVPSRITDEIASARAELNQSKLANYDKALVIKTRILKDIWESCRDKAEADPGFHEFIKENKTWLLPYALYYVFYDLLGTPDYSQWGNRENMTLAQMEEFEAPGAFQRDFIRYTYFVQWHAHRQLLEASKYAREKGIGLKGDLPIGVNKFSVDTWVNREQFRMQVNAGAPPDFFSKEGQNWGFPTYNWEVMAADGYQWWRARLARMAQYFHSYRIDHVLGFFRIWEMPLDVAYGVLGRFYPVQPVSKGEILSKGVPEWDLARLTEPYVRRHLLHRAFGQEKGEEVGRTYFDEIFKDGFKFKAQYDTMAKVCTEIQKEVSADPEVGEPPEKEKFEDEKKYAEAKEKWSAKRAEVYEAKYKAKERALLDFHENVVLLRDLEKPGELFHFRVNMVLPPEKGGATSFHELPNNWKGGLGDLYHDWVWRRQDNEWAKAARRKLRMMMDASDMLVCGEDLGMVPGCVMGVMRELCLLGLRIQRMSVDPSSKFNDTAKYEYLTVCSPSTHDMAPIRAWWQEHEEKSGNDKKDALDTIQHFYNHVLKREGKVPEKMEQDVATQIIKMHLESPSILAVFPLQDLFAIGGPEIRRSGHPSEEKINNPGSTAGCWSYRMHITLEELNSAQDKFNSELRALLVSTQRAVLKPAGGAGAGRTRSGTEPDENGGVTPPTVDGTAKSKSKKKGGK
eukprot:tig00000145_g8801.t1